ncbi:MAG TPA: hypothetical protein VM282_10315 [Acidimicrobiales bacterium]|nr:hypothetical protein [Acidimicrobiales bacterium]
MADRDVCDRFRGQRPHRFDDEGCGPRNHNYRPSGATAAAPDPSPWFEYVELISGGVVQRYFRVVAYNANGDAAASVTVCGSPPGRPTC